MTELYGYEVKRHNEQVKRNINRFPEDFVFQLTNNEIPESLKSQFATLNNSENKRGMHIKKMPYAFTEQGIYMLATVLKGELAVQQSVFIMRAFKEIRHYIVQNQQFVTNSEMKLVTGENIDGISTLYLLVDFVVENGVKIRTDENYKNNYLLGKYGAIPSLKYFDMFVEGNDGKS